MKLNARFDSKKKEIDVQPFRIVALEKLTDMQWKNFSKCMMDEYNMIERHASLLHVDSNGITNALLVLNKMTGEGILVNSEGADYARYSAYLPFAKPFLDYELALIADYCVSEGLGNTSDGLWSITFDEIREHYSLDFSEDHGLKEPLLDMLRARDEVAEIVMTEDEFEIKYSLDYCPPIPVYRDFYEEISQDEVDVVIAKHMLWLHDIPGGEKADLSGKHFRNVDFSGCKLNNASFRESLFENCNFDSAELCFSDFEGAIFKDCTMQYIAVDEMNMRGAYLENCKLDYLIGCHCNFAKAAFNKCSFFNGKAVNSSFENAVFFRSNIDASSIDPENGITEEQWFQDNGMTLEQEMQ